MAQISCRKRLGYAQSAPQSPLPAVQPRWPRFRGSVPRSRLAATPIGGPTSGSHGNPDSAAWIQLIAEATASLSEGTTQDADQRLAPEPPRFDRSIPWSTITSSERLSWRKRLIGWRYSGIFPLSNPGAYRVRSDPSRDAASFTRRYSSGLGMRMCPKPGEAVELPLLAEGVMGHLGSGRAIIVWTHGRFGVLRGHHHSSDQNMLN